MPAPRKDESKDDFISRCIPYVIREGTTDDSSQAAAICHNIWKKHKEKNEADNMKAKKILFQLSTPLSCHYELEEQDSEFMIDRCTMLVGDGMYNGMYFPASELEKCYKTFEGKPININHSDEKIEDIVGYLRDVDFKDGRITAVPVFDEETSKYDEAMGYIKSRVNAGDIPNVSVGIWLSRQDEVLEDGEIRPTAYDCEGDHLALVVHGACSPESGCGIGLSNCEYNTFSLSPVTYTIDSGDWGKITLSTYTKDEDLYKEVEKEILKEKIKKFKLEKEV
jgi:hypothetical protein